MKYVQVNINTSILAINTMSMGLDLSVNALQELPVPCQ